MCRLLGVSSSGYHAWVKRLPSRRAATDAALIAAIRAAHAASCGTYGVPRIHAELAAKGTRIGRKRVARLMTRAGLAGVTRRRFVVTTVQGNSRQAPDLVERNFTAYAPSPHFSPNRVHWGKDSERNVLQPRFSRIHRTPQCRQSVAPHCLIFYRLKAARWWPRSTVGRSPLTLVPCCWARPIGRSG
jgi:transposase InsO family protein